MSDLHALAKEILQDGYLMTIGIHDQDGPWVASVIFIADDEMNLYWLSDMSARHSRSIDHDDHIAATITAEWKIDAERALQLEGNATKVSNVPFHLERAFRAKQGRPMPTKPGEVVKEHHTWYRLKPTRIELIHTQEFGWNRKRVL